MTDEALMHAVRQGDLDSLSRLFERHHRPLFGYLYRMVGDRVAAEDLRGGDQVQPHAGPSRVSA